MYNISVNISSEILILQNLCYKKEVFSMKKIISTVLIIAMMLSAFSITAFAHTPGELSDNLETILENRDDENYIYITVELDYTLSEEAQTYITEQTELECGYTYAQAVEVQSMLKAYEVVYKKHLNNYKSTKYKAILSDLGLDINKAYLSFSDTKCNLKVTKAEVYKLKEADIVLSIELYYPQILTDPEHLYENKYLDRYYSQFNVHNYDELYYHRDENGDLDWVFVYQLSCNSPPWNYHILLNERIYLYGSHNPFSFGYGIYDVKQDEFYDVINDKFDFSKYDDFEEVFNSFNIGYPVGDADLDGELTILDATHIQRALASLCSFNSEDLVDYYYGSKDWEELGFPRYITDIDRDGARTVMDATAIQNALVKTE